MDSQFTNTTSYINKDTVKVTRLEENSIHLLLTTFGLQGKDQFRRKSSQQRKYQTLPRLCQGPNSYNKVHS